MSSRKDFRELVIRIRGTTQDLNKVAKDIKDLEKEIESFESKAQKALDSTEKFLNDINESFKKKGLGLQIDEKLLIDSYENAKASILAGQKEINESMVEGRLTDRAKKVITATAENYSKIAKTDLGKTKDAFLELFDVGTTEFSLKILENVKRQFDALETKLKDLQMKTEAKEGLEEDLEELGPLSDAVKNSIVNIQTAMDDFETKKFISALARDLAQRPKEIISEISKGDALNTVLGEQFEQLEYPEEGLKVFEKEFIKGLEERYKNMSKRSQAFEEEMLRDSVRYFEKYASEIDEPLSEEDMRIWDKASQEIEDSHHAMVQEFPEYTKEMDKLFDFDTEEDILNKFHKATSDFKLRDTVKAPNMYAAKGDEIGESLNALFQAPKDTESRVERLSKRLEKQKENLKGTGIQWSWFGYRIHSVGRTFMGFLKGPLNKTSNALTNWEKSLESAAMAAGLAERYGHSLGMTQEELQGFFEDTANEGMRVQTATKTMGFEFQKIANDIGPYLARIYFRIADAFKNIWDEDTAERIRASLDKLTRDGGPFDRLMTVLESIGGDIIEGFIDGLGTSASSLASLLNVLKPVSKELSVMFGTMVGLAPLMMAFGTSVFLLAPLKAVISRVKGQLIELSTTILDISSGGLASVFPTLAAYFWPITIAVATLITHWDSMSKAVSNLMGSLGGLVNAIFGTTGGLGSLVDILFKVVKVITTPLAFTFNWLINSLALLIELVTDLVNWFKNLGDYFSDNPIVKKIKGIAGAISSLADKWTSLADAPNEAFDQYSNTADKMKDAADKVKESTSAVQESSTNFNNNSIFDNQQSAKPAGNFGQNPRQSITIYQELNAETINVGDTEEIEELLDRISGQNVEDLADAAPQLYNA